MCELQLQAFVMLINHGCLVDYGWLLTACHR